MTRTAKFPNFLPLFLVAVLFGFVASNCHNFPTSGRFNDQPANKAHTTTARIELPNDCAIVATEAFSRIDATGSWSRILFVRAFDIRSRQMFGHAIIVWQPSPGAHVLIYDSDGALDLNISSHDLTQIAPALGRAWTALILEAHFVN